MRLRAVALIAGTVLRESVRRKEIYGVVIAACALIAVVLGMNFFGITGMSKFYREASLKIMGWSTALAVIVLAARQLPREMEYRTIYPLMARPVSRVDFLLGKLVGVLSAGLFCYMLFMLIFLAGSLRMGVSIPWALFLQHVYLQIVMLGVLSAMGFLLSLVVHTDAAVTICVLMYGMSELVSSILIHLYPFMGKVGRIAFGVLTYALPQLTLFDLSGKAVHAEIWEPLSFGVMASLSVYALMYTAVFFVGSLLLFRRRAL